MKTLTVDLGARSYPIFIGKNLLSNPQLLLPYIHGKNVLIVTNTTVGKLYLEPVCAHLGNHNFSVIELEDGEQYKNLTTLNLIYTKLLEKNMDRKTTLIALGGGVVGDITGFAAASYQRGINFIQIPTTVLAQVDSSVGGKTAVNHQLGKNMIGAFHQPQCVIADIDTLSTLNARELSAGIAEIIKYGILGDLDFFKWLELHIEQLLANSSQHLIEAIRRSCANKAAIVAKDETESGQRALLNLGHTFGHAIESHMGYGNWLHGEAVAAGMVMAAQMSVVLGKINKADAAQVAALIARAKLPTSPPKDMSCNDFLQYMLRDKKVINGVLRLVLLEKIGKAIVTDNYRQQDLVTAISHWQ